jgi:hypothetical protein
MHRNVGPDDQILLYQTLSVEEVIEVDERVPDVQIVVWVGTSGLLKALSRCD